MKNMKRYFAILSLMLLFSLGALAQAQIEVSGTVTDASGEPIIGASITVKNIGGLGAITNVNGEYHIKLTEYQTLVYAYIGFEEVEKVVLPNMTHIDVVLNEEKINAVDEVVVVGMGTQKKLTVTGAVTNVNMEDLKHYSSSNISNTLAGNVPGIIAYQTSGQPGKNTSEFWIRGISTFGASSSAYILVDGFERENIDDLNIEDIESFTVLKDASATAIYGSKGANGVILITTKHGKAGKIQVSGKVETSYNTRTITPEFVSGYDYANLINEARVTRNIGTLYTPVELEIIRNNLDPDLYPNVDWQDLLLKSGAWSTRANLNISGGGETARYYASMAYTNDQGMYKTDETLRKKYNTNANYERFNYRVNLDIDITKTTLLRLGVSGNLNKRNAPGLGDDSVWGQLFGYNALYSPIMYSNGYYPFKNVNDTSLNSYGNYSDFVGAYGNYVNPWVSSTQTGYITEWDNNIQTNVTLEQDFSFLLPGLRFVGRFGYDTYNTNSISHNRLPALYTARSRDTETGEIIYDKVNDSFEMTQSSSNDGSRREFLDLMLQWSHTFWKHSTFGANIKFTQDQEISTQNLGDDIKNSISRKNKGLAAQFTYNFKNRYFIDYNFGYNGSENFADGHRWGFFPSYSVAWNIGEEPLIQKHLPWLNMFKVRYSHGKVGSDDMDVRFPYLYTIGSGNGYSFGESSTAGSYNGLHYSQVASVGVTWEVARKDDLGVDIVLFDNKFSLTADYFNERRSGIYMTRAYLPATTGLESTPSANVGSVHSVGFDGNFAYNQRIGQVDLTIRGNLTYSHNRIGDYDEENNVYAYQNQSGYRVDQVRGLIALGLFQDYDDIRNSPKQEFGDVQPGDIKYKDVNGDGVVNSGDVCAIGATSTPNLIYGIGISAQWKGFDVNLLFQGAGKSTFLIYGKCVYAFSEGQWGNIFKGMLDDRWIDASTAAELGLVANENPNATYPRLSYGGNSNNYQASTYWLRDGRYLRLKNVDIGYTLPKKVLSKIYFQNIRFYVSGQNLWLLSKKFDTWDPESLQPRGEEYPITKAITVGVQLSL